MSMLTPGMKVYSYCYGPMTVKAVNENYVTVSVDDPAGFSTEVTELCSRSHTDLNNIQFLTPAFGHWYFDSPADVKARNENNDFEGVSFQSASGKALTRNDDYLHAYFGGISKSNESTGIKEKVAATGIKEKPTGIKEKPTGITEKA